MRRLLDPIVHLLVHWFSSCCSHPGGLLGGLVINPTDNNQAALAERVKGCGEGEKLLPRPRARVGLEGRFESQGLSLVEKGLGEHSLEVSQGWNLGCRGEK